MPVAGLSFHAPAFAAEQRGALPEEDTQPLILAINAGAHNLSSGIVVYQYRARNYLPLMELAGVFDFFIEPDLSRGLISGWAMDEENSFLIDTGRRELVIRGQRETLPDTAILPAGIADKNDLYVQQEILNRIWPVGMAVNLPALTLDVMADEKMPFMQRIARKQMQELTTSRRAETASTPTDLTLLSNKYRIYGLPAADFETWHRYQSRGSHFEGMMNVTGVQDLAWMSANYSASFGYRDGDTVDPDVIRFRLERDATQEEPLPFDLRRVELGDTRVRHSPLIGNGSSGRGVMLTSSNNDRDGEFDRITIDGTGPIGWEVELYRNGELLTFGRVDVRGEYRFEDVVLNFGNNQMRVVLYGPQGQVRESTENYQFGSNMLRPGQFSYTLGAVETGEDLIRLRDDNRVDRLDGFAVTGEVVYGLNRMLTAYGSLNTIPTDQNHTRRDYLTLGASAVLPFGSLQTEAYQDVSTNGGVDKRGNALDVRFITDLAGFKVNLHNAIFNNFESPEAGYDFFALRRKTEIGVQRNIMLPFGALGLNLDLENLKRRNGDTETNLSTRQTLGFGGVRLAHSIRTDLSNNHHDNTTGQLTVTARMKKWRLRSTLDYDVFPEKQLSAFDGELFYQATERLSASLFARHDMEESDSSGGFQVNYDFEKFIGSLETLWLDQDGTQVTLRATTSLGPYGKDGQYIMTSERLGSAAMARARVFMDHDSNGLFSEGDTPVGEARIRVNNSPTNAQTDENGILATQAGTGTSDSVITLDPASLGDPYYHSLLDGYKASLRPGSFPSFDFPVIETGAVDGTISYYDGRAVQGIRIDLVDANGVVVQSTESAYDGFYTFEYVPPGSYTVRVDPSYGIDVRPQNIAVDPDDLFASGIDLHLLEPAAGAETINSQLSEGIDGEVAKPHPESGTAVTGSVVLRGFRMGEHPDRLRLVLDLSGPVSYDLVPASDAQGFSVTLPGVKWDLSRKGGGDSAGFIAGYSVEDLPTGGVRLIITADHPVQVGANALLESADGGAKVFIDLKRKRD
jgi:hypothetical protein